MFGFTVICWALLFIFKLRFPLGVSIATISYLPDNLKIISIIYFSLYELNDRLLPLHSVTLTFIADQCLLRSLTCNTEETESSLCKIKNAFFAGLRDLYRISLSVLNCSLCSYCKDFPFILVEF
jgi:hypothetical protein